MDGGRLKGDSITYCRKIFQLSSFDIRDASATIRTSDKDEPFKPVSISAVDELNRINQDEKISRCSFRGYFNGNGVNVNVDFDLSMICVAALSVDTSDEFFDALA